MKVVLNHAYRGPMKTETGHVKRHLNLSAGEQDLSRDEYEYLLRDCPEIFENPVLGPPDRQDNDVKVPRNKMIDRLQRRTK